MLRLVEPHIAYGTPNLKTVRELVYKRGYGKVNKQRVPIDNNAVVEQVLGKYDIVCVEAGSTSCTRQGPTSRRSRTSSGPASFVQPDGRLQDEAPPLQRGRRRWRPRGVIRSCHDSWGIRPGPISCQLGEWSRRGAFRDGFRACVVAQVSAINSPSVQLVAHPSHIDQFFQQRQ